MQELFLLLVKQDVFQLLSQSCFSTCIVTMADCECHQCCSPATLGGRTSMVELDCCPKAVAASWHVYFHVRRVRETRSFLRIPHVLSWAGSILLAVTITTVVTVTCHQCDSLRHLQDNVQQVSQLIDQQMQESDSSKGIIKGLTNGPTAVFA